MSIEHSLPLLASQLYKRIDHIERALEGEFLLGSQFSIADISVNPRVAMYPMVGLPIDRASTRARTAGCQRSRTAPRSSEASASAPIEHYLRSQTEMVMPV